MIQEPVIEQTHISLWILIPLVFCLWTGVLFLIKNIFFRVIRHITQKTANHIDDVLVDALDTPLNLLVFASGVIAVERWIPQIYDAGLLNYFLIGFKAICILAVVLFVDKLIRGLLAEMSTRIEVLKMTGGAAQIVVRIIVFSIGGLIILDTLGVSITPLIASLGVGSLAVALALQPTLENLFSGIQLIADKPLAIGQFIKLESGEEGVVHHIGWRSTWIELPNNNMVIIPNKVLVNSRIANYSLPNTEIVVIVDVSVAYGSDLDKVERVTKEVALETEKRAEGGIKTFEPIIRFVSFQDSGVGIKVIMRAEDIRTSHLVRHAFIKALHARYHQESITIPYPTRIIHQAKG